MTRLTFCAGLRAVLVAAFAWAFVVALPLAASPAGAAVVSTIVVHGNQRVDADTVRAYMSVHPGRSFSSQDIDDSLKALFETGLFSDVKVAQSGNTLVVNVVENPIVNTVAFEGNKKFKDPMLQQLIQSKAQGVFTRAKVQNDVQQILELYRRSARFEASVDPQIINLSDNRVNLVFNIAEGPKTGVSRVNFVGNQAYGDRRLRTVVQTRQTSILSFLRNGDTYDPDRLQSDEDKLTSYYRDRGYADFQIVSSSADLDRERNNFFITFTVDEGQEYRFGHIGVDSSIAGVDSVALGKIASTDEGDVFSAKEIDASVEAMTIRLASQGYSFAQVRTRLDRNPDTHLIGVTYLVDEGSRAYIERIDVRGNSRTRDYVVRREFDVSEGDAYNRVLIDRAQRRLKNLNYFKDVKISTEPGSTSDRVVVVVDVTEQPTGEFSFGGGYSTADGVVGDISITERNFLGRGYAVRAAVGGGSKTRTYEFGFTDPYFLGRRISAGFDVFRRQYDENDYRSYDYTSTGGGITFGLPITEDFTVQLGYQLEQKRVDVPGYRDDESLKKCPHDVSRAICQAEGDTLVSSVSYSLIYDTLDNRLDPRDGIYAKFTQEFAGVGGDVTFLRSTAQASYYRELLADQDVIGLVKVQGGHIVGIGEDVRLVDSFFKGGDMVRGFENSGIGPRDRRGDQDALGGNIYGAATAEVQFPFPLLPSEFGLKGAVFADAGTLFDTDADHVDGVHVIGDNADLRSSVGGSVLWKSPLGPLRADFAYVLSSEHQDQKQFFRFGGGTQF